jgi:DNA-binding transcriptional MerR regulator
MTTTASFGNVSDTLSVPDAALGEPASESTIGEMAAEYGVSFRTLRFYEQLCLLRPRRKGRWMRLYSGADHHRLQMIIEGQKLGLTLTEIAESIGTQDPGDKFRSEIAARADHVLNRIDHLKRQRREIDDAIKRLKAMHARLAQSSNGHEQFLAASG